MPQRSYAVNLVTITALVVGAVQINSVPFNTGSCVAPGICGGVVNNPDFGIERSRRQATEVSEPPRPPEGGANADGATNSAALPSTQTTSQITSTESNPLPASPETPPQPAAAEVSSQEASTVAHLQKTSTKVPPQPVSTDVSLTPTSMKVFSPTTSVEIASPTASTEAPTEVTSSTAAADVPASAASTDVTSTTSSSEVTTSTASPPPPASGGDTPFDSLHIDSSFEPISTTVPPATEVPITTTTPTPEPGTSPTTSPPETLHPSETPVVNTDSIFETSSQNPQTTASPTTPDQIIPVSTPLPQEPQSSESSPGTEETSQPSTTPEENTTTKSEPTSGSGDLFASESNNGPAKEPSIASSEPSPPRNMSSQEEASQIKENADIVPVSPSATPETFSNPTPPKIESGPPVSSTANPESLEQTSEVDSKSQPVVADAQVENQEKTLFTDLRSANGIDHNHNQTTIVDDNIHKGINIHVSNRHTPKVSQKAKHTDTDDYFKHNLSDSPGCSLELEDREMFVRNIQTTVFSMMDGTPTMLAFVRNESCVATLSKKGEMSVRSRGILLPEFPLQLQVDAGMFMHNRLYVFDSSLAQKAWSFDFNSSSKMYSSKAHSPISIDAFMQLCDVKGYPQDFRVKAAVQFSRKDKTCVLFDGDDNAYLSENPSLEAVSLVLAMRHVMDTEFVELESTFSWLDEEPIARSVFMYGRNGELYELYRDKKSANLWPKWRYRSVPYESLPIPH